jgi:hypothetical protein
VSMPFVHVRCGLALLALALLCHPSMFCQVETATISGTISDRSGAVIVGADVELVDVLTGKTTATKSNESGLYVFATVRPGEYRMTVKNEDFKEVVLSIQNAWKFEHYLKLHLLHRETAGSTVYCTVSVRLTALFTPVVLSVAVATTG